MDDAAILARLDGEPDAFALFHRRHAGRLLDDLASRVDDARVAAAVCAETFALALERAQSFDPASGSAEAWLDGIAARLPARARGEVSRRAQRRLGMAPLEPGDRFLAELEEELVAAARFRAARPRRSIPRPSRRAVRGVLGGVAALALVAAVAAFALDSGDAAPVEIELPSETDGCAPAVSARLLERVAALRRAPQSARPLPQAALDHLRGPDRRLGAIAVDGARLWASGPGVEFWVVPVVKSGTPDCAPAGYVCVIAVPEGAPADSYCVLDDANWEGWQLAPLRPGNAVVLGLVPSRATGARVTIGDQSAPVEASQNVLAGVLPFPYDDFAESRVDPTYARDPEKPRVGVVDAAGGQGPYHAEYLLRQLAEGGYPTVDRITPGIKAQRPTYLYWRPGEAPDLEIGRIARLLAVDRVIRIDDPPRVPGPVLRTDAPIVIVAGQGVPSPG